ncbi:MAG TPA: hypothetical protein VFZ00_13735 [Solirubrobacter sp.]|nr:hypothetical protein [Solirubrobacter sp.]
MRAIICIVGALAICGTTAGAAWAGNELFMSNQGLSAGNAYASTSAHTGVWALEGDADHTHCPAVATGYAGYTSSPFSGGNSTSFGACGPHYQAWYPSGLGSVYRHGAEYNPNQSTFDSFVFAIYHWS